MPATSAHGKAVAAVRRKRELLHDLETVAQRNEVLQSKQALAINGRAQIRLRHVLRKIELHGHNFGAGVAVGSDLITTKVFDQRGLRISRNRIELFGRDTKTTPEILGQPGKNYLPQLRSGERVGDLGPK